MQRELLVNLVVVAFSNLDNEDRVFNHFVNQSVFTQWKVDGKSFLVGVWYRVETAH